MRSLLLIAALTILGVSGCDNNPSSGSASVSKKPTRDDFRKMLTGKTKDEVLKLAGKPYATDEVCWSFERVAVDPVNGKIDESTYVYFDADGRVSKTSP